MWYLDEESMDAKQIIFGLVVILALIGSSGCTEQGTTTKQAFENVEFESDVVDLAYANVSFFEKKEYTEELEPIMVTKEVEVKYLFHNKLDRRINVSVTVEFYSEGDELVHRVGPRIIHGLLKDYTERQFTEVNIAKCEGEKANRVSYVKILAHEA